MSDIELKSGDVLAHQADSAMQSGDHGAICLESDECKKSENLSQEEGDTMLVQKITKTLIRETVSDGFFYYFGYGSNLLKERIHVQIKGAIFETTGVLSGHELTFYDSSKRWFGAIASIEPHSISQVWGCVWKVPNSFADELDLQEGGYHRLDVNVLIPSMRQEVLCRTYQYSNPAKKRLPPSPHYKHVIVRGAMEHGLPTEYIEKLMIIQDNGYKGKVALNLKVLQELNREPEMDETKTEEGA